MATKPSLGSFAKVSFLTSSFQPNPLQAQVDQLKEKLDQNKRESKQALETKENEKQDMEQRMREIEEEKQQLESKLRKTEKEIPQIVESAMIQKQQEEKQKSKKATQFHSKFL